MDKLGSIEDFRMEFPVLARKEGGVPIAYLDNAATTQKPRRVITKLEEFFQGKNANVHRGLYRLAEEADEAYDNARKVAAKFLNAACEEEIIFTSGTTEGMNLAADVVGGSLLNKGDEVVLTEMEHHSVIVPWVRAAKAIGAKIRVAKVSKSGKIESLKDVLSERTKIVAFTHISNVLGSINDAKELTKEAKQFGAVVVIDGAQAVSHHPVDVQDIGCDFYAFSGHKAFGPTGIGVLYGGKELLTKLPPYQVGGGMIENVSFDEITYGKLPQKFEAGTPPISEAVALGEALLFIESLGVNALEDRIAKLGSYLSDALSTVDGLAQYGDKECRSGIASFSLPNVHPHDIATVIAEDGICIRAGHHCCMPLMDVLKVPALARVSLAFYNTEGEINRLIKSILKVRSIFK